MRSGLILSLAALAVVALSAQITPGPPPAGFVPGNINITGDANVGGDIDLSDVLIISGTAPTIDSGFGTAPSITANNGTAAFRLDVGTGGVATGGVIGLPTATTGWNCFVTNITDWASGDALRPLTLQTASTTTTATLENQVIATGVATLWAASDILAVSCFAF